jgi:hypothetical protein
MKYRNFELLVVAFSPGLDLLWLSCNPGIIVLVVISLRLWALPLWLVREYASGTLSPWHG